MMRGTYGAALMRSSRFLWCATLLLVFPGYGVASQGQSGEPIRVTFIDVGQADAILIRSPEGQIALVDAGRGEPLRSLGELGVEKIDLLVATHPHADHIGGMAGVINSIPVRFYMDNGQPHTTATYQNLMRTLQQRTDITYLAAEPRTIGLGSAEIEVLPLLPVNSTDHNNRSVGLVLRYGSFVVFLSGDSEVRELAFWVQQGVVPDVTVLKAPHHGSDNGFTWEFLQDAQPEVVVISVGGNSYGHPRPEALQAYTSVTPTVLRTDYHGQVTILGYEDGRYEVMLGEETVATGQERETQEQRRRATVEELVDSVPPVAPSVSGSLSLGVFADAPGNDHQNPNGEYAVLESGLSDDLQIGGWFLCDAASHCFQFPSDAVLRAGGQIVVYTGSGRTDGVRFFMGSGRAVWNNDGDTATLYDASSTVVAMYVYE